MADAPPILLLDSAQPADIPGEPSEPALTLTVGAGDLLLVEARDLRRAALFTDMCTGLVQLHRGRVRFLSQDWTVLPFDIASALRGHVGRIFGEGSWIGFMDMETNILLSPLYHTRRPHDTLRADAALLAQRFGLPGLPLGRAGDHHPMVLRRAACVRAFLGEPMLLLLEEPIPDQDPALLPPLLSAIEEARDRGAAVIWLTSRDRIMGDSSLPATARLRLVEGGLVSQRIAT